MDQITLKDVNKETLRKSKKAATVKRIYQNIILINTGFRRNHLLSK